MGTYCLGKTGIHTSDLRRLTLYWQLEATGGEAVSWGRLLVGPPVEQLADEQGLFVL